MKPYFVKYLPVEGEIKEGDSWMNPVTNVYWEAATKEDIDKINSLGRECKKTKLFLCSRDIQVGDKVTNNQDAIIPWNEDMQILFETGVLLKDGLFKIVGEISPEAVWVKEGDEFISEGVNCEVFPLHNHKEDGSILYVNQYDEPVETPIYLIKCPTCKKFH